MLDVVKCLSSVIGFCLLLFALPRYCFEEEKMFFLHHWNQPAVHNGEYAGGGPVAVVVGISDVWQVSGDTRHPTRDTWHMTCDTSQVKYDIFYLIFSFPAVRFCPFQCWCYYLHTLRDSVSPICGICIRELLSVCLIFKCIITTMLLLNFFQ